MSTTRCLLCGNTHPIPSEFQHLTMEDLCPTVALLNDRLMDECLTPSYTHPHWLDPSWETDIAPLVEIKSYSDYLTRLGYKGELSPRGDRYLKQEISKKGRKNGGKVRAQREREARTKYVLKKKTSVAWYEHMRGKWIARGIGCTLSLDEWLFIFHKVVIVPEDLALPMVLTLWEYTSPEEVGGLDKRIFWVRRDTSKPICLENILYIRGRMELPKKRGSWIRRGRGEIGKVGKVLVDGDTLLELVSSRANPPQE